MNNNQRPIAVGRTAEVYPFGDGKVLKLFFPFISQSWVDKEAEIGRNIQNSQLPVPKVYERVNINEREGVVYEKLEGPSLLHELAKKPWKVGAYARRLALLHIQVHKIPAPANLETQREWAGGRISDSDKLPKDFQKCILQLLDSMPDGDRLCHGDFHPGNIIITQRGPVIIDWMAASKGMACGDVARASIIMEAAIAPEGTPMRWLLEKVRRSFLAIYLKIYFQLQPAEENSFTAWRTIMAANFFADVTHPQEAATLMAILQQGIGSLADG